MSKKISKKIKIILKNSLRSLGKAGNVVHVKEGYFRNYLETKDFATIYSKEMEVEIQANRQNNEKTLEEKRKKVQQLVRFLGETHISYIRKASGTGVLFGSVELKQIKKDVEKLLQHPVRKIELLEPIKKTGKHLVNVDIFEDQHEVLAILVEKTEDDLRQLESEYKSEKK